MSPPPFTIHEAKTKQETPVPQNALVVIVINFSFRRPVPRAMQIENVAL